MKTIGKLIKATCTAFGAIMLICIVICTVFGMYGSTVQIQEHSVITVDFSHDFSEQATDDIWDELIGRESMRFADLLKSIELAATDERIDGIIAKLDISDLKLAQIQDVARAILTFRKSGKKAYVFSQGFGPLGQGNREYYLATFFDKIYMQPHTTIGLTGIGIELPFARSILDKLGVYPEFYTRYEYKTAMMSFTDEHISDAYMAEMTRLGNSLMNDLKKDIVNNRKLTTDIDTVIDEAPLNAEKGKEYNLIDEIMYLPDLEEQMKKDGAKEFVALEDYASQIQPNEGKLPTIAVLNLTGLINSGKNTTDFDGQAVIGSQSVAEDLAEIEELDNLKALVVRIDSPGGSYNAADEIYYALKFLKNKKKIPIIVSQSGYAASGGYFVSLAGDVIMAEPTTITGSIGVLGGKFVLQDMWNKIGLNWTEIKIGKNAGILSVNRPFSADEKRIFNQSLDEVYKDFTAKVKENRRLTQNIDEVARGRVWTGSEALKLGLVDKLGGYSMAIGEAKDKAGIAPNVRIKIITYPREKSFSEKVRDMVMQSKVDTADILTQSGVDIRYLKLFKRLQYDTVLLPFMLNI